MKHLTFFCIIAVFLLAGCNNNKPKEAVIVSDDGKAKVTVEPNAVSKTSDAMTEKIEELKKLTPLSLDELKKMIPEELMGMKRTNFSANSMMGAASCNATYKGDNEKQLKVTIFDCAGEAGAGIYSLRYWTLWNFQQEDDNGYQKTIDFNGGKAIEKYSKYNDEYSLTYVGNDRLLVSLEGEKTGLDGVKQATQSLNLK